MDIAWRVLTSIGSAPTFELEWIERAPEGFTEGFATGERAGFGSKLVNQIVPAMLRGEASRTFDEKSFVYRLIVPLEAVVAPEGQRQGHGLAARLVDQNFGIA